jgi:hypothetical protein
MPNNGFHVCFSASDKEAVLRFQTVALAEGGRDNGDPATAHSMRLIIMARS